MKDLIRNNKYSLIIIAGLVSYFFIMRILGLHENIALRVLNAAIVYYGLNLAMKDRILEQHEDDYISNFFYGLKTGVIAVIGFCFFGFIYLSLIEPGLVDSLGTSRIWGSSLNALELSFALLIEGWASVIVLNLIVLQRYKNADYEIKHKIKDKIKKVTKMKEHQPTH